jgi:phenylacetic acid degradation operon negative regulatory protein
MIKMGRSKTKSAGEIKKYKRGELAKEILFLIAAGLIIPASLAIPNLPVAMRSLLEFLSKKGKTNEQNFVKSVNFLKKEKLISIKEKNGEQIMGLSEKGRKRILKFKIDEIEIKKPVIWDGYWRIIVFDIPEKNRVGRDILRNALKRLKFYQLQKSCFVCPYHCKDEIDFITEIYRIAPYTNYILAKEIEGSEKLKKFFNL